jgi:predicted transcriptional regulator
MDDLNGHIPVTEEVAADAETLAAIDRGIKDADEGRTVSLDEASKLILSGFPSSNHRSRASGF